MELTQRILVVDDVPANLFALEQVLSKLPFEIVSCATGNDALIATTHHRFSLALLDVQMPEMDGYELASLLRAEPSTANLPIIFISAINWTDDQILRGYAEGAVDFLTKPYHPDVLCHKVQFFLQSDLQ